MNPRLKINSLRLSAETENGSVSRKLDFTTGLNLLRADNTSGKSTALQGIIYALGLEGMLGPSHRVPLPHAMTDQVSVNGVVGTVTRSGVELEIENAAGDAICVSRPVVDPIKHQNLVSVDSGPSLTVPSRYSKADYFVRRQGAAQNMAGFHRYLADFLGLTLPQVTRMDGSEGPLYLETLFPYFFVEQKHGWSGIQARIPSHLGIRDVGKRTAEYILGLEAFDRVLQIQRIRSNIAALESEWQSTARQATEVAKLSNVVIQQLPQRIKATLDTSAFLPVVSARNGWVPLDESIQQLQLEVTASSDRIPTAEEVSSEVEQSLRQHDASLRQALAIFAALEEERTELEAQRGQVQLRLNALSDDLQRHKDSRTLEALGSEYAHALIAEHTCPTCRQHLSDGAEISEFTMSIDESIDFIGQQIKIFEASAADTDRVLAAMSIRQESVVAQLRDHRRAIRVARETLTASSSTPSAAEISRRLILESRIEELSRSRDQLGPLRDAMERLSSDWAAQQARLRELNSNELSESDRAKVDELEQSIRGQLNAYGFRSLVGDEIDVDLSTYRPTHEGFDLGFDLSASDMIRVIWAYLFAILRVGSRQGNHLGLLIFDEPRQQDTARASYQALLHHASSLDLVDTQVIFATSEPSENLRGMLGAARFNLIDLPSGAKLLQETD